MTITEKLPRIFYVGYRIDNNGMYEKNTDICFYKEAASVDSETKIVVTYSVVRVGTPLKNDSKDGIIGAIFSVNRHPCRWDEISTTNYSFNYPSTNSTRVRPTEPTVQRFFSGTITYINGSSSQKTEIKN